MMVRNLSYCLMFNLLTIGMLLPTLNDQANAAGTVLLVSDSATDAKDAALITFLEGLGHTVDTSGMNQAMRDSNGGPNLAVANAAELVVISRWTSSIQYGLRANEWNSVTSPLLLMNGFLLRDTRFGWMSGTGIEQVDQTATDLTITNPIHPYAAGLAGTSSILDWSTSTVPGTADGPADELIADPADFLPGTAVAGTLDGKAYALSIPAGTTTVIDDANHTAGPGGATPGPLGGRRGFVAAWSYPNSAVLEGFGAPFMTANYETLLANAVGELIAPSGQPGDFDGDLDVDGADFLKWQRDLGDATSLATWEGNFGTGSAVSAVSAVPEPSSLLLACTMAMATFAVGRCRLQSTK